MKQKKNMTLNNYHILKFLFDIFEKYGFNLCLGFTLKTLKQINKLMGVYQAIEWI